MYTKNPVSGRNETLVNTSMLKGALDGVTAKIDGKADKGALDSLSAYAVGITEDLNDKADRSEVQALSEYVEGRLPKTVHETMVDAYVGLACKIADPDVLEGAAKMAYAADPVKYVCSNPDDDDCRTVHFSDGTIRDAVAAAGSTVELPPLLRLKSVQLPLSTQCTSWKTELPNLDDADHAFAGAPLTEWTVELPNLTYAEYMFSDTSIEEWTVELPNLVNGEAMFQQGSESEAKCLKRFRGTLPALIIGTDMFRRCQLDIDSIRCIAETIKDVSVGDFPIHSEKVLDITLDPATRQDPNFQKYVEIIQEKGWNVAFT